jgi:hypothetical protein
VVDEGIDPIHVGVVGERCEHQTGRPSASNAEAAISELSRNCIKRIFSAEEISAVGLARLTCEGVPRLTANALIRISQGDPAKLLQDFRAERSVVEQSTRHMANAPVRMRQAMAEKGSRRDTRLDEQAHHLIPRVEVGESYDRIPKICHLMGPLSRRPGSPPDFARPPLGATLLRLGGEASTLGVRPTT